jgi:3D (Asp-Asp-Asp) domain-containing protein
LIGRLLFAVMAFACLSLAPALAVTASALASVTHVTWHRDGLLTWERVERRAIPARTVERLTPSLAPGRSKVIVAGKAGVVEIETVYAQRNGGPVRRLTATSKILRAPHPRIVAEGIGGGGLWGFEARGITRMGFMARSAILMLATAYTADSAGGDGMTAIGRRAGHGIVAVDPRVIPLGTRLYIPGYGLAIAGDTGGAIVGNRIDLGFDSLRDAMLFGRRAVTVYRLK